MKDVDDSPESMAAYLSSDLISVKLVLLNYLGTLCIKPSTTVADNGKFVRWKNTQTTSPGFPQRHLIEICLHSDPS